MTRFEREISGSLGEFWKKNAEEEVRKAVAQADTQATADADGAIKWNSNGRYLMDDFCEKLEYAGYAFDREARQGNGMHRMRRALHSTAGTTGGFPGRRLRRQGRHSGKGQRW